MQTENQSFLYLFLPNFNYFCNKVFSIEQGQSTVKNRLRFKYLLRLLFMRLLLFLYVKELFMSLY